MSFNVGINLVEVDGRASQSMQPAATSVTGFIVRSARGDDKVHPVTNWTQFVEKFGSYVKDAFGAHAVRGFFDNGGSVAYVTRVAPSSAQPATVLLPGDAMKVTAAFRGQEDRGAWGNGLVVEAIENRETADPSFNLTVRFQNQAQPLETWIGLNLQAGSNNYAPSVLNDADSGSKYIMLGMQSGASSLSPATSSGRRRTSAAAPAAADGAAETPAAPAPAAPVSIVVNAGKVALTGGTDGDFGDELEKSFLAAVDRFEKIDIQLLCSPDFNEASMIRKAVDHSARLNDRMFIGCTPIDKDATAAKAWVKSNNLQGDKVYGALYFPWIRVSNPVGREPLWIPPVGHVAGIFARTDRERGVWKAPAGNAASVQGAIDVRHLMTDEEHTDLVVNGSVNGIRPIPGKGIVVDASRTLSTNTLWLYVGTRLLFNYVKSTLKTGLRFAVQEPNDKVLWGKIKFGVVTPFLLGLWRKGAFGSKPPEQVFCVKVDEENNPPDQIKLGYLNVEVYFYPVRPAETIVIIVGQQDSGASVAEA